MSIGRVFAVLLVALLFLIGVRPSLDPDMWWHLRTGELIWAHGVPRQDVFSFTRAGQPWIAHEWLSEAFMWLVYRVGGFPGLILVFAGLSALALRIVHSVSSGPTYLKGALTLLGAFVASPILGVRPQVFNFLFAAVFVAEIESYRTRREGLGRLVLLPAYSVLWANLHSGYLIGIALLIAYACGELLESAIASSDDARTCRRNAGRFTLLAVACLLGALLNPNHVRLWTYPFGTLGSQLMQENIAEWRSPDFHDYVYWPFGIMLALGSLGLSLLDRRPTATQLILFLSTAAAALVSNRHVALFAVVTMPIVSGCWAQIVHRNGADWLLTERGNGARLTPAKRTANWAMLVVGICSAATWAVVRLQDNEASIARVYPVSAVDYLEKSGLDRQRGYNSYAWGGYLIWRGIRVFVDGRADVYGEFLSEYLKTLGLSEDWLAPLDRFGVGYVLIERTSPLATLLTATAHWQPVYADNVARIFVRQEGPESPPSNSIP